jgi:hypothetical protein
MNPEKFIQRIRLFNDIINEVINMESNYRTELNVLNLKIVAKIEEYINQMNSKKHRQSIKSSKTISIPEKTTDGKPTLKHSKSKDNFFSYKEEDNPMVDKLISESLQNFLTFYKTKHKLISKEVCDLSNILFEFTSSIKKFDNYNEFTDLEKCKNDFEINYTNFMKSKKKYLEKMNNLEIFFQEEEKSLQIKRLNSVNANNINKNNANNNSSNNDNQKEKEKIDQIIDLRQKYKNSLIELTKNQKIYVTKLNELGNDIKEFNENENNILYDIFKVFEDNILSLLKEINNFRLLFDNNKQLIKALNAELENNLIYDGRLYFKYQFEDYKPKNIDVNNPIDFLVVQKMSKLIGFEFDKIKSKESKNEDKNKDNKINDIPIDNKDIDDNLLFILLMDKIIDGKSILNEKEKDLMKNLFNKGMYMKNFLSKLNNIRMNIELFSTKERFYILVDFFNYIFTKLHLNENKEHELVKYMMILSETFKYMEGDKKIFLNNAVKVPNEFREAKFWIKYIELEIEFEYKKYENKKDSRCEYIVFLSNTTHLKEYLLPKETVKQIIEYFQNKYNYTDEEINILKSQIDI